MGHLPPTTSSTSSRMKCYSPSSATSWSRTCAASVRSASASMASPTTTNYGQWLIVTAASFHCCTLILRFHMHTHTRFITEDPIKKNKADGLRLMRSNVSKLVFCLFDIVKFHFFLFSLKSPESHLFYHKFELSLFICKVNQKGFCCRVGFSLSVFK